jgi:hypothetical protein
MQHFANISNWICLAPFLEISDVLTIYVIPADTPNIALPSASPVLFKPSGNPIICRFT